MRIGLLFETKNRFPSEVGDPSDISSELLSDDEENELLSGLRDGGHEVIRIGDVRRLVNRVGYWRKRCELVFNRSAGYRGVERKLLAPAILDAAGMPYIGSTPYVLTLTRHKYHAKLVAQSAGLLTPAALLYPGVSRRELRRLKYPVIVKPVAESSSIGIGAVGSVVAEPDAALRQAQVLHAKYSQPALIEEFVEGAEVEVPLFIDPAPRALGVVALSLGGDVVQGSQYLSAESVYDDMYGFAPPPNYVDVERLTTEARRAARAFGLRDYARLDFRVSPDGTPWFIEASAQPHIQRHSSFYELCRLQGRPYFELLDEIVGIAAARSGLRQSSQY